MVTREGARMTSLGTELWNSLALRRDAVGVDGDVDANLTLEGAAPTLAVCTGRDGVLFGGAALACWQHHFGLAVRPVRDIDVLAGPAQVRSVASTLHADVGVPLSRPADIAWFVKESLQVRVGRTLRVPFLRYRGLGFMQRLARLRFAVTGRLVDADFMLSPCIHPSRVSFAELLVCGTTLRVATPVTLLEEASEVLHRALERVDVDNVHARGEARAVATHATARITALGPVVEAFLARPVAARRYA